MREGEADSGRKRGKVQVPNTILARSTLSLLAIAIVLVALWCVLALLLHPWLPLWLGVLAAAAFAIGALAVFRKLESRARAIQVFAGMCAAVVIFSMLPQPTHDQDWAPAQAVMPKITFNGDLVTIANLRRTVPGPDGASTIEHYDRTYDMRTLESVWYGVQHLSGWKGLAHTFISFGFADGEYLAISIESRRGPDERFSPVAGMFRNYGMIYVMGDEMEVIGWRSITSDNPIYLYPIKANKQGLRNMLTDVLKRASELNQRPEFYDTWTNNCTNNIVRHFNQVTEDSIWPYSPSVAFPGYTGRVAYEQGLIDSDGTLAEIQERALINDLAREVKAPEEFSTVIRRKYRDSSFPTN